MFVKIVQQLCTASIRKLVLCFHVFHVYVVGLLSSSSSALGASVSHQEAGLALQTLISSSIQSNVMSKQVPQQQTQPRQPKQQQQQQQQQPLKSKCPKYSKHASSQMR